MDYTLDEIVRLVASDGATFYLERKYAEGSAHIKNGLNSKVYTASSLESMHKTFTFPDINGEVLEKVVQYLHFKFKYQQLLNQEVITKAQLPEFEIDPQMALDVLIAADFLQC